MLDYMKKNTANKIILFSPLPPPEGGLSSWTEDYLTFAESKQFDVDLINTSLVGKNSIHHEKRDLFFEFKRILRIRKQINRVKKKNRHFDGNIVVHYNTSCSFKGLVRDYYFILKKIKKYKIVMQCHCDVSAYIKTKTHLKIFKKVAKMCKKILVLNPQSQKFVETNVPFINCCYFPNFVKFSSFSKRNNEISCVKNVAYVGHVRKEKGFEILCDCATKLPNLNFHIFGQIPDNFEKPVISNITFYGAVAKGILFENLKKMDVLLAPSFAEGFSISLLECLASGLIIVSSPAGSASIILSNTNNIVTKSYDSNGFLEALEVISSYSKEKIKLTSEKNIILAKKFDIECVLEKLFEMYNEV